MSEPLEDVVARELPPWMRAEASASVSRSADSTGAAHFPGQQGAQQASSTEQQSLQVRLLSHGLPPIKNTVAFSVLQNFHKPMVLLSMLTGRVLGLLRTPRTM